MHGINTILSHFHIWYCVNVSNHVKLNATPANNANLLNISEPSENPRSASFSLAKFDSELDGFTYE